jgi:hypothetical protein
VSKRYRTFNLLRVIRQRGVDRGELRGDVDSEVTLDLIYGPSLYPLMTEHAPVNELQTEALVTAAFRALQKKKAPA